MNKKKGQKEIVVNLECIHLKNQSLKILKSASELTHDASSCKEPKEKSVEHHCNILPILNNLIKQEII